MADIYDGLASFGFIITLFKAIMVYLICFALFTWGISLYRTKLEFVEKAKAILAAPFDQYGKNSVYLNNPKCVNKKSDFNISFISGEFNSNYVEDSMLVNGEFVSPTGEKLTPFDVYTKKEADCPASVNSVNDEDLVKFGKIFISISIFITIIVSFNIFLTKKYKMYSAYQGVDNILGFILPQN